MTPDERISTDEYLLQLAMGLEAEHRERTGHRYDRRLEGFEIALITCPTCIRLEKLFGESERRSYDS
jgi:hypothetical protein